jgi:hypothetical protein
MFPSCTLKGTLKNDKYKTDTNVLNDCNEKEAWWKQKHSIANVGLEL